MQLRPPFPCNEVEIQIRNTQGGFPTPNIMQKFNFSTFANHKIDVIRYMIPTQPNRLLETYPKQLADRSCTLVPHFRPILQLDHLSPKSLSLHLKLPQPFPQQCFIIQVQISYSQSPILERSTQNVTIH